MKVRNILCVLAVFLCSCATTVPAPTPAPIPAPVLAQTPEMKAGICPPSPVNWAEDEANARAAVAIRAKELEEATGIHFSKGWHPCVSFENVEMRNANGKRVEAMYTPENATIHFSIADTYTLNVKYQHTDPAYHTFRLADPTIIADDDSFSVKIDHEVGHALADDMSRQVRGEPYYTVAQFDALSRDEQIGLTIVSEGIGGYFERALHPQETMPTKESLPSSFAQQQSYPDEVIFDGGLWIVNDILKKYKEPGLAWLVTHPFVPRGDDWRTEAERYRSRALTELARG